VQLLLEHKANVDVKDNAGCTALYLATYCRRNAVVQLLKAYKAIA
jgi:ankyrin repeat protein